VHAPRVQQQLHPTHLESKFDALLLRQVTEQHAPASSPRFRRAVRDEAEGDWEGLALENDRAPSRARQAKMQQEQAEAQQHEVLRKLSESEKQKRDMQREAERRAERATKEALESARRLQEAMERRANEPGFLSGFFVCFILAGAVALRAVQHLGRMPRLPAEQIQRPFFQ
jgi:hypothetical protein